MLNNLSLKQSALDDLQLPVKTVSGYLGEYLVFDIEVLNHDHVYLAEISRQNISFAGIRIKILVGA